MKKIWFMSAVLIIFSLTCVNSVIFGQEPNEAPRAYARGIPGYLAEGEKRNSSEAEYPPSLLPSPRLRKSRKLRKGYSPSPPSSLGLRPGYSAKENKKTEQNLNNIKYLDFERINFSRLKYPGLQYLEETDDETGQKIKPTISWLKNRENRWVEAFQSVVTVLPESFFKKIGKTSWIFNIDQNEWMTASPREINLLPSLVPPHWMTWEPFPVNGYSQEEMMFVALHELGHIYDGHFSSQDRHHGIYYWRDQGISWWNSDHLEAISSIHCSSDSSNDLYGGEKPSFGVLSYKGTIFVVGTRYNRCYVQELFDAPEVLPLDGYVTLYSRERGWSEDFAESIALYVMWPEYLKNNFRSHYTAIKKILGKEYRMSYPMPNSIKSKLVVK